MTLLIVFFHDQTNIGKLSILLRNYMHFVLLTVFGKLVIKLLIFVLRSSYANDKISTLRLKFVAVLFCVLSSGKSI